eukprot:1198117-Prymnesium_polylepis.2
MADASAEHARLACAVSGVVTAPKLPAAAPPAAGGTDPQKPSANGGAGDSECDSAIAAVMAKGDTANDDSNRAKKKAKRVARSRLPDGKWCKSGTCQQYNHDEKHPGKPCYSDPRVEVTISFEASQIKGYKGRLEERRAVQGRKLGVTPKPVKIARKGAAPANPLVAAAAPPGSFDGLDDWGRGAMTIGDIASGAAPANPILPDGTRVPEAPTVQGTPVFYSADELRDALESDDDGDDLDDGHGSGLPGLLTPSDSEDDDEDDGRIVSATWAASSERAEWQEACDEEHHNLASHD